MSLEVKNLRVLTALAVSDSRRELKRTLRIHELGVAVTLVVSWAIAITITAILFKTLLGDARNAQVTASSGIQLLIVTLLCWIPCCHYLWLCYRTGLRDVRRLYQQLRGMDSVTLPLVGDHAPAPGTGSNEKASPRARSQRRPRPRASSARQSRGDTVISLDTYRSV